MLNNKTQIGKKYLKLDLKWTQNDTQYGQKYFKIDFKKMKNRR